MRWGSGFWGAFPPSPHAHLLPVVSRCLQPWGAWKPRVWQFALAAVNPGGGQALSYPCRFFIWHIPLTFPHFLPPGPLTLWPLLTFGADPLSWPWLRFAQHPTPGWGLPLPLDRH